jgi:hypothetical protein
MARSRDSRPIPPSRPPGRPEAGAAPPRVPAVRRNDVLKTWEQVMEQQLNPGQREEMLGRWEVTALARFSPTRRLQAAMRVKRRTHTVDLGAWLSTARELRKERLFTPPDTLRPPEFGEAFSSTSLKHETRALSDGDMHRRISQMRTDDASSDGWQ